MKQKKILIDLSVLKRLYCGLGQVAYNYGLFFKNDYIPDNECDIYLFVPKHFVGAFGDKVKYICVRRIYKTFPFLLPKFDVWHAIHQLSRYKPYSKSTKYILTIHDFNYMYEKAGKKVQKYQQNIQQKVNRADTLVCISQFAKSETEKYMTLQGKPIQVILNGVETLVTTKAREPKIDVKQPFFFTIGEQKPKKNFHVLLDMMKLFPQYQLYIAGNNQTSYANKMRQRITLENISNVHLLGPIEHAQKIWFYEHCAAFLFPSLFEGFGLPVIEAMQLGKPVFSSKETSLSEIGGEFAYFFDSDFNPQKMKELVEFGLNEYATKPTLAESERAYALNFSYIKHLNAYLQLYKS